MITTVSRTRTDAIMRAVADELERRRPDIDTGDLRVVSIIVTLNHRTGYPLRVVYRTESQHDLIDG